MLGSTRRVHADPLYINININIKNEDDQRPEGDLMMNKESQAKHVRKGPKRKYCTDFRRMGMCSRGEGCPFLHVK